MAEQYNAPTRRIKLCITIDNSANNELERLMKEGKIKSKSDYINFLVRKHAKKL